MTTPRTPRQRGSRIAVSLTGLTILGASLIAGPALGVTNGAPADRAEYPFMVALEDIGGEQFCGGAIIAADKVLTAAHCVEGESAGGIQVSAGTIRLGQASQTRGVASIDAHPNYARTEVEDVAVLHLTQPFDLGGAVNVIRMAAGADTALLDHASPATTMGWGSTSENGDGSQTLLEADVNIIGDSQCAAEDGDIDGPTMICAGGEGDGKDSCYGDSGGPLIVRDDNGTAVLAGIVSFGIGDCGGDAPGVYADVAGLRTFIDASTPDAGNDEGGWWNDETEYDDEQGDWWNDETEYETEYELDHQIAARTLELAADCVADGGGVDCIFDALERADEEYAER